MNPADLTHVLIVDDDARLRHLLAKYLCKEGFTVTVAQDVAQARANMEMFIFDLIILDVMMPGGSGTELTTALRAEGNLVPVILLTAMAETQERISGLESGADDYLTKPFEPRELVLRMRNLLRRGAAASPAGGEEYLSFGEFRFYPKEEKLLKNHAPVYLTTAEGALLALLAQHAGSPLGRAELTAVLPQGGESERGVDVHITRLRKKMEEEPARPRYLQTVRGAGYILRVT